MRGAICGVLAKDAKLKYTGSGTAILEFQCPESFWSKKQITTWYNCTIFGARGEKLRDKLVAGTKVTVFGHAYLDVWTNDEGKEIKTERVKVWDITLHGGSMANGVRDLAPAERETTTIERPWEPDPPADEKFEDDIPW